MAALATFYRVLSSNPTWSTTGNTLTLQGRTSSIKLTATGNAPSGLTGSRWTLEIVTTIDPHGVSGAIEGPTLVIGDDNTFHATDSCNTFAGAIKIHAESVTFAIASHTTNVCPQTMRQQMIETIDKMLSTTVTFTINYLTLVLNDPGTNGMLMYSATTSH